MSDKTRRAIQVREDRKRPLPPKPKPAKESGESQGKA